MVVLQLDDGVIDQRADGQGQAAQRHGVDGVAGDVQADDAPPGSPAGSTVLAISVMRQLPRKIRIITDTRTAPMMPFVNQAVDGLA